MLSNRGQITKRRESYENKYSFTFHASTLRRREPNAMTFNLQLTLGKVNAVFVVKKQHLLLISIGKSWSF